MKVPAILTLMWLALLGVACNDGSETIKQGTGGSSVQSTGGNTETGGTVGTGGSSTSTGGTTASGGVATGSGGTTAGGSATTGGGGATGASGAASGGNVSGGGGTSSSTGGITSAAGTTSTGGATSTGGVAATGGTTSTGGGGASSTGGSAVAGAGGSSDGLKSGPFKMLVLSKCLEFAHDSIATGQAMLTALGKRTDAQLPAGAKAGSQFTVTIAKDDLSDFTTANLAQYEIIFWMNPTGTVFTSGGANGTAGKAAVQKFMEGGGAWAGVHSATDFEKTSMWPWFQDQLSGAWFDTHDNDGTPNSVVWQTAAVNMDHPVIRGIKSPWSCSDEWYFMNRNPENVAGFTILGKLSSDQRPVVWVRELPGGGRSFYTIRGHNKTVYAEPNFMNLVHQGILWAVHRMK